MHRPIFTFDTTHHALWAEEIAKEHRLAFEIVPAPSDSNARCDIALETLPSEVDALAAALEASGVEYRIYRQLA